MKKFNICGSKPQKDNPKKRHFYQVGAMFLDDSGKSGSIVLDSIPVNFDGKLHFFTPSEGDAS